MMSSKLAMMIGCSKLDSNLDNFDFFSRSHGYEKAKAFATVYFIRTLSTKKSATVQ